MPPVPSIRGERVVRALEKAGFAVTRIAGSHHIMRHPDGRNHGTCPSRPRCGQGTLRGILSDAGMTIEELQRLLLHALGRSRPTWFTFAGSARNQVLTLWPIPRRPSIPHATRPRQPDCMTYCRQTRLLTTGSEPVFRGRVSGRGCR